MCKYLSEDNTDCTHVLGKKIYKKKGCERNNCPICTKQNKISVQENLDDIAIVKIVNTILGFLPQVVTAILLITDIYEE